MQEQQMRQRILGLAGGKRRRRFLLGVVAAVTALGAFMISNALAVHDLAFQLDGDVSASTATNVGGSTQPFDWDSFFDANGNKKPLPAGFDASAFDRDFLTKANGSFDPADTSIFTTGSKDTLPIASGWQCKSSNNVNSKDDIMNAYSAAYTASNGDEILYFALEKNANEGNNNVGFWFLQDGAVGCDAAAGTTSFSGNHQDGDLLIVSAFTNGGSVSTIDVYRWNGGANGSLGTTPVLHGVDCQGASPTPAGDGTCATVNAPNDGTGGTITTPWLTANKDDGAGHSLRTAEFFEGGINLTANNLGNRCFNTFLADTRSSQSLTATLFDFSRGQLGECTSATKTTPVDNDGNDIPAGGLTIPTDPNNASIQVKDEAEITVTGVSSFDATVSFHLCGPNLSATDTCASGGVDIGSKPVTSSGTVTSDAATITSAGRYCWRADFSGDSDVGVPGSSDSSLTECFTVNPVTPTLTTQAGASPVDFGQPVTDTATLTGTAHQPGTGGPAGSNGSINPATLGGDADGTITFTLYKDNCTDLATGTGTNPQTVDVNGDGTYGPVSFTPDAPGDYHWVATYSGDAPNTLAADSADCGADPNEDVTVRQIPTAISTAQKVFPQDSATINSTVPGRNLPAGGTVIFRLYGPTSGASALENCLAHGDTVGSGGLLYKETNTVGGSPSVTTGTNNTTVAVSDSGAVYWRVTYDPNDSAFTGRQSDCVENTVLTFNNDAGPGTLFP
jgi:hypothetical protein